MQIEPKKPTLLMLSHCLPDARGNAARARAWQLLRLVHRSHRVCLVCRLDGPVRMDQWELVRGFTHRLLVQMPRAHGVLPSWLIDPAGASLAVEAQQILEHIQPTVLLCTHPSLWRQAAQIGARVRICDVDSPLAEPADTAQTSRWSSPGADALAGLTRTFQLLTLGHSSYATAPRLQGFPTLVLPAAVDLEFFGHRAEAEGQRLAEEPRLVFHSNLNAAAGNAGAADDGIAWFRRQVWPAVKRAVPAVELGTSQDRAGAEPLAALDAATVVVSAETAPGLARWPLLQAMATTGPLIARDGPATDLGARHGIHLLAAHRPSDWADLCIESLRSARIRLRLARGARAFLESRGPIEQSGGELLGMLGDSSAWRTAAMEAA